MKSLPGVRAAVPIVAAVPDDTVHGVDLIKFADLTSGSDQGRAGKLALFVQLSGGVSTELAIYVRDKTLGWALCHDTNNPGLLGGRALPSDASYVFVVSQIGIFAEFLLLKQNTSGPVAVDLAQLVAYVDKVETIT